MFFLEYVLFVLGFWSKFKFFFLVYFRVWGRRFPKESILGWFTSGEGLFEGFPSCSLPFLIRFLGFFRFSNF